MRPRLLGIRALFLLAVIGLGAEKLARAVDEPCETQVHPSENKQGEVSIAVDPSTMRRVLMTAKTVLDCDGSATDRVGRYMSVDFGCQWDGTDTIIDGKTSDPVVAIGPAGEMYHAYIAVGGSTGGTISVLKSDNAGFSWSDLELPGGNTDDKQWMCVDQSASDYGGNLYLAWTCGNDSGITPGHISFTHSTDGGETFSALEDISGPIASDNLGVSIAVDTGGRVCAAWFDHTIPPQSDSGLIFNISSPGGASFPDTASRLPFATGSQADGDNNKTFPSIAVDTTSGRYSGTIYLYSVAR